VEKLKEALETFGPLKPPSKFLVNRGRAMVYFEGAEVAAQALSAGSVEVDGTTLTFEPLKAKIQHPKAPRKTEEFGVFITGMSPEFDQEELKELITSHGKINKFTKKVSKISRESIPKVYVIATFASKAAVDSLIASGISLGGANLVVEEQKPKKVAEKKIQPEIVRPVVTKSDPRPESSQIHIAFLNIKVSEEEIRAGLSPFGDIKSIQIRPHNAVALVVFSTKDEMDQAVADTESVTYKENVLKVRVLRLGRRNKDVPENTIHVSGFEDLSPTEGEVKQLLSKYGSIASLELKPRRATAHVEFATRESALKAIEAAGKVKLPFDTSSPVAIQISENRRTFIRRPRRNQADK